MTWGVRFFEEKSRKSILGMHKNNNKVMKIQKITKLQLLKLIFREFPVIKFDT